MTARCIALVILLLNVGCSDADRFINEQLASLVTKAGNSTIDLAGIGPRGWERLCVIGPHATNEITKQILGFEWDSERKSSIGRDDGIYLLVFVARQRVVAFAEYPRDRGDFVRSAVSCVPPTDAVFRKEVDGNGWTFLVHQPRA